MNDIKDRINDQKAKHKKEEKPPLTLDKFITTDEDFMPYLTALREGTFKVGTTFGFPGLDKFLVHKRATFNICGGVDNVGKSTLLWYFLLLSAMLHGYRWIIYSSENSIGAVYRKLIEFYWCEGIKKISDENYLLALSFVKKHFTVIKNEEVHTYTSLEEIIKHEIAKSEYFGVLIDPYNSLKSQPGNKHENDYDVCADILSLTKKNNLTVWVNAHVYSDGARAFNKNGFQEIPHKSQLEGGNKFANRCHDLFMTHRLPNHVDDWMWTQIHTQKIKESETGGGYTPKDAPFKIKMVNFLTGFEDEMGYNPVREFHKKPIPVQAAMDVSLTTDHIRMKENTDFDIMKESEDGAPF